MPTLNPDLKKLFVYVNFNTTGIELTSAITELVRLSNEKYKDRIFFLENTGEIISDSILCALRGNLFLVLVVKQEYGKMLVHVLKLVVVINGLKKLVPVFVKHGAEDDNAVVGVILVHVGGKESDKGLILVVHGIEDLKLKLSAVVVNNSNKIASEFFAHSNLHSAAVNSMFRRQTRIRQAGKQRRRGKPRRFTFIL